MSIKDTLEYGIEQDGWESVHRIIFPISANYDRGILYTQDGSDKYKVSPKYLKVNETSYYSAILSSSSHLSFATYFNSFPAAYWKHWTHVNKVRLFVKISGSGKILLYKSNVKGDCILLDSKEFSMNSEVSNRNFVVVEGGNTKNSADFEVEGETGNKSLGTVAEDRSDKNSSDIENRNTTNSAGFEDKHSSNIFYFDVSLNSFSSGGYLWFDIVSDDVEVIVESASWCVPILERRVTQKTHSNIGITTFNMGVECIAQLERLQCNEKLMDRICQITLVDQGTNKVRDTQGYEEQAEKLAEKFKLIEQPNLGGSGGFSRSMYEMLNNPNADYVLLLDDDAVAEPESILRAIQFADYTCDPTIVGGHMFNLNDPTVLHSLGERVGGRIFFWGPVDSALSNIDFRGKSIRSNIALNKRIDVGYNGWWMCLIPKEVVESIGLSLPIFIKWDDAEYGMRAANAGFSTVSMPGVAVWHLPWTIKNDRVDWQAYYHQRNRWITAFVSSDRKRAGWLGIHSFANDLVHLISMQYTPVKLRNLALKDLLVGPYHLHKTIISRAKQVREEIKSNPDTVIHSNESLHEQFGEALYDLPLDNVSHKKIGSAGWFFASVKIVLHQFRKPNKNYISVPRERVSADNGRWWGIGLKDSVLVNTPDGLGAWWYKRNRRKFVMNLYYSVKLHLRVRKEWDILKKVYSDALPDITSPESWKEIFESR